MVLKQNFSCMDDFSDNFGHIRIDWKFLFSNISLHRVIRPQLVTKNWN